MKSVECLALQGLETVSDFVLDRGGLLWESGVCWDLVSRTGFSWVLVCGVVDWVDGSL